MAIKRIGIQIRCVFSSSFFCVCLTCFKENKKKNIVADVSKGRSTAYLGEREFSLVFIAFQLLSLFNGFAREKRKKVWIVYADVHYTQTHIFIFVSNIQLFGNEWLLAAGWRRP